MILLALGLPSRAQEDHRSLKTRIADLLAQFPASGAEDLERLMKETITLGPAGLVELAGMYTPQQPGDYTAIEYALGGLSFYAMQQEHESLRSMISGAYIEALENATDAEGRAFFVLQLQRVGKDEAVPVLKKYLEGELCGPAARAMVSINTPSAKQALLEGLSSASGECRYSLIEALGDVRNLAAVNVLTGMFNSDDMKTQKLVLYALATIGDPSSGGLLAEKAGQAGYMLDETNATASFLLWMNRMNEAGNVKAVEKLSRDLLKKLDRQEQVHTKTAALKLLVEAEKEKASKELMKAAIDANPEFRAAALGFISGLNDPAIVPQVIKSLSKTAPAVKADLIAFLGENGNAGVYDVVAGEMNADDITVKVAALKASAKLNEEKALPVLLEKLKTADKPEGEAIMESLLTMKSAQVTEMVAQALSTMSSPLGKTILIQILGERKASDYSRTVVSLVSDANDSVRAAAFTALPQVAAAGDKETLYTILQSTKNDQETALVQKAIINAVGADPQNTSVILGQIEKAAPGKKHLYFGILSSFGSAEALKAVVAGFHSGDKNGKKAAITALGEWRNGTAARELLQLAKMSTGSPDFNALLQAFFRQINMSELTGENKYLLLREAMPIAKTLQQKRNILTQVGKSKTLPALMYLGGFLDDQDLKGIAANGVLAIALDNKGFHGAGIREILEKTFDALEGQESAYQKQSLRDHMASLPEGEGFVSLFNGKDLSGWKGLVGNPLTRATMDSKTLAREQAKADEEMRQSWQVEDGKLVFTGKGNNISTVKKYRDFEMYIDWKITEDGDAGIYLRGTPQVQIWDTSRVESGAQVGSGGLYNNKINESKPLKVADNPVGEWNTFRIIMKGEYVTVYLNGELVVDRIVMENYWDREQPVFPEDYVELQAHGTRVEYRDIYIREIPQIKPFELSEEEKAEGFQILFDGTNLEKWQGNKSDYIVEDGDLVVRPRKGSRGNLYTNDQYGNFIFRFEFQLTPGANNGLGIRAPLEGDAAYVGMELQILDNTAEIYSKLHEYQYHGSVYGIIPAKRGFLKPVGEWNYQEVIADGTRIKVILNGQVILDGDIAEATKNGPADKKKHPGLMRKTGHIGFLGHGSVVRFRNIRVKDLEK